MSKAKTKTSKAQPTQFDIHLWNGEWFARVTFSGPSQVRRLFPRCRIVKGDQVYLAQP